MTDAASAIAFLKTLFSGVEGDVYLCSLPNRQGARPGEQHYRGRQPGAMQAFIEKWDRPGRGLFFCISTLKPDATPTKRGSYRSKANCWRLATLPIDIDFARLSGIDNPQAWATGVLERSVLPPQLTVLSGHGMHAYWLPEEKIDASLFGQAENMLKRLSNRFASDPAVCDVSRLMRLPGSTNSKEISDARPVIIAKNASDGRVSWAELEELVVSTPISPISANSQPRDSAQPSQNTPKSAFVENDERRLSRIVAGNAYEAYGADAFKAPIDVEARLAAMRYQGEGDSGVHVTQLAVTAALLNRGMPFDEVVELVLEATMQIASGWDRTQELHTIEGMCQTWLDKHPRPNGHDNVVAFPSPASGQAAAPASPQPALAPADPGWPQPRLWVPRENVVELDKRRWLYERHYARRYVSGTIGASGVGKSSLVLVEAVAMASGRNLLGHHVEEPLRVWYHNGEEHMEELDRRLVAICAHYDIRREEIDHTLFITTSHEQPWLIGSMGRNQQAQLHAQVIANAKTGIQQNRIDVLTVDPLAAVHAVEEADNNGMGLVARAFASIANDCNCAVELVHHPRKTGGNDLEVEDARGASALVTVMRSVRLLNSMSESDAGKLGASDNRHRYFRLDSGKNNIALPADKANWYQLVSVTLANEDEVGVVAPWEAESPFADISTPMIHKALETIRSGGPWRKDNRSKQWVGLGLAEPLNINAASAAGQRKLQSIIADWIKNKVLIVVEGLDAKRMPRQFVEAP